MEAGMVQKKEETKVNSLLSQLYGELDRQNQAVESIINAISSVATPVASAEGLVALTEPDAIESALVRDLRQILSRIKIHTNDLFSLVDRVEL